MTHGVFRVVCTLLVTLCLTQGYSTFAQNVDGIKAEGERFLDQKRWDDAIGEFSRMIEINRSNPEAFRLRAKARAAKKDWKSAIEDYRQAVRLDPKLAEDYFKLLSDNLGANPTEAALFDAIAWLQATCPEPHLRKGKAAVTAAQAACEMTEYKNGAYLATLGAACAEAGDFENAVTWTYGALDIAPQSGKGPLLQRVKLFEKRQPYRDTSPNNAQSEIFDSMFNGRDLTGWSVEGGNQGQWSVEGTEIVGRSDSWRTRCYLLATQDYADFVLRFQFRIEGRDDHGGIAIRGIIGERLPLENQTIFDHPIIKLRNTKRGSELMGTTHWVKNADINTPPLKSLDLPPDEWINMEVTVRGDQCRASVGGIPIVEAKLDQAQPGEFVPGLARSKGKLGFQINTGVIRFRKIEIKELWAAPK